MGLMDVVLIVLILVRFALVFGCFCAVFDVLVRVVLFVVASVDCLLIVDLLFVTVVGCFIWL